MIGKAVRETFKKYFPDPLLRKSTRAHTSESRQHTDDSEYAAVVNWFEAGNKIELSDDMPLESYFTELNKVKGLRELTTKYMKIRATDRYELSSAMEFTLDGLHQFSKIAKDEVEHVTAYKDLVGSIFTGRGKGEEEF